MSTYTLLKVSVPNADKTGWTTVDVAPPNAGATIREFIGNLVLHLREMFTAANKDTSYLTQREAKWVLTHGELAEPLNPDKTLEDLNIIDGDHLYLAHENARESFTRVMDDTSDAIAKELQQSFPEWSNAAALRLTAVTAPVVAAMVSLITIFLLVTRDVVWYVNAATAAGLTLVGVLAAVYAVPTINTTRSWEPLRQAGLSAVVVADFLVLAAAVTAVPGMFSSWHLVAGGAAVLALSLVLRALILSGIEALIHGGTAFGTTLIVSGAISAVAGFNMTQMMVVVTVIAVFLFLYGSKFALSMARIPLPYIPAAGETFVRDTKDFSSVSLSTDADAVKELINMTTKISAARQVRTGILASGIISVLLSFIIMSTEMGANTTLLGCFMAVIVAGMVFHGATESDAALHTLWYASALCVALVTPFALVITGVADELIGPAIGVVAVGFITALVLALRGKHVDNPRVKRFFEIIEGITFFAPMAMAVFLLDIYGIIVSV